MRSPDWFRVTWIELNKELRGFFFAPTGYIFLAVFLVITTLLTFTYGRFFERGEAFLAPSFFTWLPTLFCFFIPALAMRVWSTEIRGQTLELLLSHPLRVRSIVWGKFLFVAVTSSLALLGTFPVVVTVGLLGDPDWGMIFTGYLGSLFLIASYAAVSCFFSAMFKNSIAAYIVSVITLYLSIIISSKKIGDEILSAFPDYRLLVDTVAQIGVKGYYVPWTLGLIELRAVIYFTFTVALFVFLNCLLVKRIQTGVLRK